MEKCIKIGQVTKLMYLVMDWASKRGRKNIWVKSNISSPDENFTTNGLRMKKFEQEYLNDEY